MHGETRRRRRQRRVQWSLPLAAGCYTPRPLREWVASMYSPAEQQTGSQHMSMSKLRRRRLFLGFSCHYKRDTRRLLQKILRRTDPLHSPLTLPVSSQTKNGTGQSSNLLLSDLQALTPTHAQYGYNQQPQAVPQMTTVSGGNRNARNLPLDANGERDWSNGLCSCFGDFGTCCVACWCPCIVYGQNKVRTAHNRRPSFYSNQPSFLRPA